jgi:hypothetical protein
VGRLVPGLVEDRIGGHNSAGADQETGRHQEAREEPLPRHEVVTGRAGFVACLTVMVLVGAGAELATVARSDIAFLLYAAERVLDGARLYVDIVEINPPLIVALNLPAVLLARAIGVSDIPMYRVLVTMAL